MTCAPFMCQCLGLPRELAHCVFPECGQSPEPLRQVEEEIFPRFTVVYVASNGALARWVAVLITPLPVHASDDTGALHHLPQDVCADVTSLTTQCCLGLTHSFAWQTKSTFSHMNPRYANSQPVNHNSCTRENTHTAPQWLKIKCRNSVYIMYIF